MGLEDQIRAFTVELTTPAEVDVVCVHARLEHEDWIAIDEDDDSMLYRWSFVLSVTLESGEVRRGWRDGSHDDANLIDNVPSATIYAPASALRSPLRAHVQGELVFEAGPRIAWAQELDVGAASMVFVDGAPAIGSLAMRSAAPTVQTIAVPEGTWIAACLPEVGLVSFSRTTGYALHTPSGTRALPDLDAIVDGKPGGVRDRKHRGGPRGRLAIETVRDSERLVVVEIYERSLRQIHASDGVSLTRGGFDASGSLLLVRTRGRRRIDERTEVFESWTQVLDCDANQLLDWRGESADLHGRWQIEGDVLAGTTGTVLHRVPRTGPATSARVSVDTRSHPRSAWNAASGVAAWNGRGGSLPAPLHCYHPSWGVRTFPTPPGAAEPLAVLRDGRVIASGDRLLIVDPAREEIVDLGETGYLGDLIHVVESDAGATLWTQSPAQWRIDIPLRR